MRPSQLQKDMPGSTAVNPEFFQDQGAIARFHADERLEDAPGAIGTPRTGRG
jgi:hypothetical protein